MLQKNDRQRLHRIREAYDLTVEQYDRQIEPFSVLPKEFFLSKDFQLFLQTMHNEQVNSGNPAIQSFLKPEPGQKYLDAGCGANLANYRLYTWPSIYFGIDLSPKLIQVMQQFTRNFKIKIGGLCNGEISHLPYEDNSFDLATVIGVFEYYSPEYAKAVFSEIKRVLKPGAKLVFDVPNQEHHLFTIMKKTEQFLNRPIVFEMTESFENLIRENFELDHREDSKVMTGYFVHKT